MPSRKHRMSRGEARLQRVGNYGSSLKRGGKLKHEGKTGRKNRRALRVFKVRVGRYSIDRCEARYEDCAGTEQLTWAHGRKRRELQEGELEDFAIVACVNCHRRLDERMTHDEMAAEVSRVIALRPERYLEAA